jgi:hypothetical protein
MAVGKPEGLCLQAATIGFPRVTAPDLRRAELQEPLFGTTPRAPNQRQHPDPASAPSLTPPTPRALRPDSLLTSCPVI